MKILLDECVTKRLIQHLKEYEVFTVTQMRWNGLKNGKLLTECVNNTFDLVLTIDKNLMFQQNLDKYPITIAVLNSKTSKIEELVLFMPSFKAQLDTFKKHNAYLIDK
jgi:predicted nuclease of predicted toxin-antitoxin system